MKDVFLVYDKSCFYEIVILNYFMSFSNCDMVFCSLDGTSVRTIVYEEIPCDQVFLY